jgi:hypothetical protein
MNKIEFALKLAKDCTYADEMTEGAKEHLRNEIDEALKQVKNNIVLPDVIGRSEQLVCDSYYANNLSMQKECLNCGKLSTEH